MVGHQVLTLAIGVRVPVPQPSRAPLVTTKPQTSFQGLRISSFKNLNPNRFISYICKVQSRLFRVSIFENFLYYNLYMMEGNQKECWFCNKRISTENSNLEVSLYRIEQRHTTPVIGRISTEYHRATVILPRCVTCERRHDFINKVGCLGWLLISLAIGFLITALFPKTFSQDIGNIAIVSFFAGILIFPLGIQTLINSIRLSDTKPQEYMDEYPSVKELLSKGYEHGEKPHYKGPDVNRK